MKKIFFLFLGVALIAIYSCKKELSFENPNNPNSNVIVGNDCRVNKIAFSDSLSDVGTGSVSAVINSLDTTLSVSIFDSLANAAVFDAAITYSNDTIFINANELFVVDLNNRVTRLHGLLDPSDPGSPEVDIDYTYDGAGHLIKKSHSLTSLPNTPFEEVNYTYTNNNLTGMTKTDLTSGDLIQNAVLTYHSLAPKNFIYLFPDEEVYTPFNQFFNFGTKSVNAVKSIAVTDFDPGNVPAGTTISTFDNYVLSLDNYVLSATMSGDDAAAIPAFTGRLKFSYKCK
jgi:hypothetical protein